VIRRTKVPRSTDVKVTFSLPLDAATGTVSVVGDFNGWTPGAHPLVKRANGTRSVSVTLAGGTKSRFRYLGENGHWFDDPEADALDSEGSVIEV
jgi:1,4-alpha-glucan branching enzyme